MTDPAATSPPWEVTARRKREQRAAKIPPEWRIPPHRLPGPDVTDVSGFAAASGLLTARELRITRATASDVVARVARREWTAVEVAAATCKRAAVAQQLLNCLTEIMFDEALARARELDEFLVREGRAVGPLHGLPVSLKDQFNVKGVESTIGYVALAGRPVEEDATLVRVLVAAGAVLYAKTNVPTSMMMAETVNNLFGRTLNPFNRALTPGGSSGGEAALIAFRGSFLGVGTDIGGSVRHPCSYTGLFGLRPSHGRVPLSGVTSSMVGQEAVRSVAGPMARSPADLRLFMAALAAQKPWLRDSQTLPLPWRAEEEELAPTLCFGFAMGDGRVSPSPPLRRAMELTRAALLDAGHRVVEFGRLDENREAHDILQKMWTADGGEDVRRAAGRSGEPLPPAVERWIGETAVAKGLKAKTSSEMWETNHKRAQLAAAWMRRWAATEEMTGTGRPIDALILPSTPLPAVRHDDAMPWQYGFLPPLLDLTSAVFPVTKVDQELDGVPADFRPVSRKDKQLMDLCQWLARAPSTRKVGSNC
jgi:amidase